MKPYRPASGTEGEWFINTWCERCWHDRNEDCPILAASFIRQVPEWVMDDDETEPRCTQFATGEEAARRQQFPEDERRQLGLFGDGDVDAGRAG